MPEFYSDRHNLSVRLDANTARVFCSFADRNFVKAAGFEWDNVSKTWFMKAASFRIKTLSICKMLGLNPNDVEDTLKKEADNEIELLARHPLSSAWDLGLAIKLFPYQYDGANYALHFPYLIIGDEMGLGKTPQAIAVIVARRKPALVVCPAFLRINWRNEIRKFAPRLSVAVLEDGADARSDLWKNANVVVVSYELFARNTNAFSHCRTWIADEAHYLKSAKAKRTMAFIEGVRSVKPESVLFLTGTAILNRVSEFYNLLFLTSLSPKPCGIRTFLQFKNEKDFTSYFSHKKTVFIGNEKKVTQFSGLKNHRALKEILRRKYIRRQASEHLPGLPSLTRQSIEVSGVPPEKIAELETLVDSMNESEHYMHRKIASAATKAPFTIAFASNILDQDESVLIFSDHVKPAQLIAKELERYGMGLITGATPPAERQALVDRFQAGTLRVLVATIGSANAGLTLTRGRYCIYNDLPETPGLYLQSEKRMHRISQDRNVFVYAMKLPGLDTKRVEKFLEKVAVVAQALSDGKEDPADLETYLRDSETFIGAIDNAGKEHNRNFTKPLTDYF